MQWQYIEFQRRKAAARVPGYPGTPGTRVCAFCTDTIADCRLGAPRLRSRVGTWVQCDHRVRYFWYADSSGVPGSLDAITSISITRQSLADCRLGAPRLRSRAGARVPGYNVISGFGISGMLIRPGSRAT
eukprot:1546156-Rhodomonas_salina.1